MYTGRQYYIDNIRNAILIGLFVAYLIERYKNGYNILLTLVRLTDILEKRRES